MDFEDYQRWLGQQQIARKTQINQLSRARRLEGIFGDLQAAFDEDGLRSIIRQLEYSEAHRKADKPLPARLEFTGDIIEVMRTLKHAATTCRRHFADRRRDALRSPIAKPARRSSSTRFEPIHAPIASPTRQYPPTGFWTFQANSDRWDIDAWTSCGDTELAYRVSKDDRELLQIGDLGLLRRVTNARSKAAIMAIVEVISGVEHRADPDPRFYPDPAEASVRDWRTTLSVLAVASNPIPAASLPETEIFDRLRRGWQRTTTPIPPDAFVHMARLFNFDPAALDDARAARTVEGVRAIERDMQHMTPQRRKVASSGRSALLSRPRAVSGVKSAKLRGVAPSRS